MHIVRGTAARLKTDIGRDKRVSRLVAKKPVPQAIIDKLGHTRTMLTLEPMRTTDLNLLAAWLETPEVGRWWLAGSTIENEINELRQCILGAMPTTALLVVERDKPIGWCEWYLCEDYPEHAREVGAEPGDAGIDYAIGDPTRRGTGVGTRLIATLVSRIRQRHPRAGMIADPEASNAASRRVLEKNGFLLLDERPLASEPTTAPMAIYRLPPDLAAGPYLSGHRRSSP
jgi:RimJ/RimL family protein N-acetyltransferase